jgi:dsDNA-specific endonuclease/ATPase MutS2
MFISKGRYVRKEPLDKLMNLNLVNFSKESYYRENDYFEEKAVLYDLLGRPEAAADNLTIPEEIREVKIKADNTQKIQKKKEPEQDSLEVDLHYEELSIQNSQLSPGAILALQMSRFHAAIEEAISKNLHRLVIIHGLGQGTLKMQIRKELQEKYPEFIYQDASFKEYGFGATMVHLTFDQKQ